MSGTGGQCPRSAAVDAHGANREGCAMRQEMGNRSSAPATSNAAVARAFRFVVLIGIVSFFADMTYEGARGIVGPYLAILGASATAVGIVAGLGELLGYGLRMVSGRLADETGEYWPITLLGYAVQMASVPLLALAGRWEIAAVLIVTERIGKAIRNPPRDVMLSYATKQIGHGWGFGLHEALDQAGALVGPLVAAAVLYGRGQYRLAFAILLVPAILTFLLIVTARLLYPRPRELEAAPPDVDTSGLPAVYWLYLAGAALVAAGFADFSLVSYHFEKAATVQSPWIPIFYAVAMATSGAGSLVFGRAFDRFGIVVLIPLTIASALFAPLVFLGGFGLALVGTALWGLGMGVHESIMAAAVATMVPAQRRGSAYGIFNTGYGIAWFVGSALMGILYDASIPAVIIFSVVIELSAITFFLLVSQRQRAGATT
ncbi:MAG TPA: MFS transporter [Chloroflexota bacterium]|nr:MFS transporter [Chloroflexota bacterium]